jgi:hypothetical protein
MGNIVGLFERKKADVIERWYAFIPGLNTSMNGLYTAIEKESKERQVPGLETSHVEFC